MLTSLRKEITLILENLKECLSFPGTYVVEGLMWREGEKKKKSSFFLHEVAKDTLIKSGCFS